MICKRKNGNSRLNRRIFLVLSLILSLFLPLFSSTLNASAISPSFDSYYGRYTDNWTSSQGTWTDSIRRYGLNSLSSVYQSSGRFDFASNKATPAWHPIGYSTLHFETNPFTFTDSNASFHAEINYVFSSIGTFDYWTLRTPLDLNVISCNRTIASQNVSYHITPWTTSFQSGQQITYVTNDTLTLYVDLAFKNLPVGDTGSIFCAVDGGEAFVVTNSGSNLQVGNTAFFVEKFDTNLLFFSGLNDALQTATNAALQQQTTIMEWQKQHQLELEEKERQREEQLQNLSNGSTSEGNGASSDASSATSSLLGVITGIYGVLLHPTTTDCIISGVEVYDLNLGNLDFCTGFNIPQPIFAIGALIMIGIVIVLAWSILKAGMSLYNELLGGKN